MRHAQWTTDDMLDHLTEWQQAITAEFDTAIMELDILMHAWIEEQTQAEIQSFPGEFITAWLADEVAA